MMTATTATVVTASKVNLKVMMRKVLASLTEKASFNKSPRNHVIIVKIGKNMSVTAVVKCPRCFWHDNNSICPICHYEIPVDNEHIKEAFSG